jgi:hypothetical protein
MCIRYHIEHWLPVSKDNPDWERRVRRGLAQPGMNSDARKIPFHECRGRFLLHATCPRSEIRDGGCWRGRILPFCYQDNDCFLRLAELQAACTAAKREAEVMDVVREAPLVQNGYTERWRKAYDDWMMAYENHRDCPDRRYRSEVFQGLKRAGVVLDQMYIPDSTRLGAHPSSVPEPIVGITRHYNPPVWERRSS